MDASLEDEMGDIVQKARDGKDWSQQDLAQASGISLADIARVENCQWTPDTAKIRAIAETLGLHAPALVDIANKAYLPKAPQPDAAFELVSLRVFMGIYPVKCYLIICRETRETAIIDTGGNPEAIIKKAGELGVRPTKILLTHTHPDHAGGLQTLTNAFGCPVWTDKQEPRPSGKYDLHLAQGGDHIKLGKLEIRVISTPGHTSGGICYKINDTVVSGDAIFAGSMGRANSSFKSLFASVAQKLLTLPDHTGLYPAHGPATTVGQEKRHNPFFCGTV